MMNFFLLTLLFVASTLANVIREEQDICFNIAGVNLCGDPSISGKRDEQNVCFHVGGVEICGDPSISGKRDQQNVCFHVGGVEICGDPSISGKRDEQNICFHVGGVEICGDPSISGKRDEKDKRILPCYYIDGVRTCIGIKREEDLNLAEIVTNIGNVIHVIDQFVGGAATKREEQDSVGCIIAGCVRYCQSSDAFTNICKREEQNISIPFCYTLDGVKTCIPNIKREDESLNLADIVANIGKVIHVIDGFVSGATS
ncbi:uncharacterized protein LOC106059230 [Biomphalaria glabrata]|uniref:Uncharacterized protein LOC106059230 n=1 Tax=Biomphalaria glabrata TaxID=6526 RepID=A0A9W2ZBL3_BIOGL|nr:uncharacterized protein LOC106059230 [Biomphalaria glabrata]